MKLQKATDLMECGPCHKSVAKIMCTLWPKCHLCLNCTCGSTIKCITFFECQNVLLWHNFHRSRDNAPENNSRHLRPGKVSPRLSVPNHIQRPPYVNSRQQRPGMNNGPEIHDEKGIECMRASGKLAAQVLKFAGTLVKVMSCCYKSLILSISKLLFPLDKPHSFYSF